MAVTIEAVQARTSDPASGGELERLIDAVGEGDQEAFSRLYDATAGYLLALIRRIVVSQAHAEDVLQETFLQVWRRAPGFDPARGSAKAWLAVMARGRAVDCVRSSQSRRDRERSAYRPDVDRDDVAEAVAAGEQRDELSRAMAGLSAPARACIEAVYFRALTHRQAAQALGMPLGTVKTHVRNGIAHLRGALEGT